MKIQMKDIKPANNELRENYDEQKLVDLQWSLMEEGQVEPIKVCKNGGGGYEIVYGHRRYFAAYKAGWDEIEALVVEKDEVDNLIHAGIENLAKEDLSIMERANWAKRLHDEFEMSEREIARKTTVSQMSIHRFIVYRRLIDKGLKPTVSVQYRIVTEVAKFLGEDNIEEITMMLDVIEKRGYTYIQSVSLVNAYTKAETPELKEAVLNTGIGKSDTWEDVLHKARFEKAVQDRFPETFVFKAEWERELMSNENTHPYVKKFYGSLNSARRHILLGPLFVQQDLFRPDEAKATIKKIDETINELTEYKQSLRAVK